MKITNHIFKTGTTNAEEIRIKIILDNEPLLKKLVEDFHNKKSVSEIAEESNMKRTAFYYEMKKIFEKTEALCERMKDLLQTKKAVIDLNAIISEEWIDFVAKYITIMGTDIYTSTKRGILITDRYFSKYSAKQVSLFYEEIVKAKTPVKIEDFAKQINKTEEDIVEVCDIFYKNNIFIYREWIIYVYNQFSKKGYIGVLKNLLQINSSMTIEEFYKIAKNNFPYVLGTSSYKEFYHSLSTNHRKIKDLMVQNKLNKEKSCYIKNKKQIVDFCIEISLQKEFCSTDAVYLAKRINQKFGCEIEPNDLKVILMESGEFIAGKKTVLAHKTKKGCEKITLKELVAEILSENRNLSNIEIVKELYEKGRSSHTTNIATIASDIRKKEN